MTTVLLLAATALICWPGGRRARLATAADRPPAELGRRLSPRHLQALAVSSLVLLGAVLFGLVAGLLVGAVLGPLAAGAVARLAARRSHSVPDPALAFTLDLAAAALRAGQPVGAAVALAAPAAAPLVTVALLQVAGLLRLGADPIEAWALISDDPTLGAVALAARRSSNSGARLAAGWEQLAADLRAELSAAALARAQRAGVWAMAPLGLCFLPAFVCLGVVPTVIGVAHSLLLTRA